MANFSLGGIAVVGKGAWLNFLQITLAVWVIIGAVASVGNSVTCQLQYGASLNFCLFKSYFGLLSFLLLAVSLIDGLRYVVRVALLIPYVLGFLIDISYLFFNIDLDGKTEFVEYLIFFGIGNSLVISACIIYFRAEATAKTETNRQTAKSKAKPKPPESSL